MKRPSHAIASWDEVKKAPKVYLTVFWSIEFIASYEDSRLITSLDIIQSFRNLNNWLPSEPDHNLHIKFGDGPKLGYFFRNYWFAWAYLQKMRGGKVMKHPQEAIKSIKELKTITQKVYCVLPYPLPNLEIHDCGGSVHWNFWDAPLRIPFTSTKGTTCGYIFTNYWFAWAYLQQLLKANGGENGKG